MSSAQRLGRSHPGDEPLGRGAGWGLDLDRQREAGCPPGPRRPIDGPRKEHLGGNYRPSTLIPRGSQPGALGRQEYQAGTERDLLSFVFLFATYLLFIVNETGLVQISKSVPRQKRLRSIKRVGGEQNNEQIRFVKSPVSGWSLMGDGGDRWWEKRLLPSWSGDG